MYTQPRKYKQLRTFTRRSALLYGGFITAVLTWACLDSVILSCLLLRPTNAQYINSNVYFVKHSDMFRCIYIIFGESFLIQLKLQNQ